MAQQVNPIKLLEDLAQFKGTEQWYRHPVFRSFLYTDGVKYLAEKAGAYWLLDYIFSNQTLAKIKAEEFQVWKIFVKDEAAEIKVEDGNDNIVYEFKIAYTDFPLEEFTLWFLNNQTLILPSEY